MKGYIAIKKLNSWKLFKESYILFKSYDLKIKNMSKKLVFYKYHKYS